MKCINMKIGGTLIFIANFITIYSTGSQQDKTSSQTTTIKGEDIFKSKLNKDCPRLLEIVRSVNKNYNFTDYGIDCKPIVNETISKEATLQYVCFVIRDLLSIICDYNFNMTTGSLKQDNADLCPLSFSHLDRLGIKFQYQLLDELTNKDDCLIVCYYDLNKPERECSVLSLYNNYLKSVIPPKKLEYLVPSETENSHIKSAETETAIQKTENTVVSTKVQQQQEKNEVFKTKTETTLNKLSEAAVTASKTVKVENKTEKLETIPSTPKKEQTSESELKSLGIENSLPGIDEELNNEEDLGVGDISSDMPPVPEIPKLENMENKNSISSPKIYSDNGFFQAEDSHFFFYFIMVSSVIVLGYLAFHNKNKILAYALEGTSSRRRGRRPNPARYKKLETNLEEVISSSSTNVAASSVVY